MMGVRVLSLAALAVALLFSASCTTKECVPPRGDSAGVKLTSQRPTYEVVDDAHGSERRAILKLGGQFCEFDLPGVEQALLKVPGVKAVDLRTMIGAAMVTYEAGPFCERRWYYYREGLA